MKLKYDRIDNEEVPVIILDCEACGEGISIHDREVKATRPIACTSCNHTRSLSYQEFLAITSAFAIPLLNRLVTKLSQERKGHN